MYDNDVFEQKLIQRISPNLYAQKQYCYISCILKIMFKKKNYSVQGVSEMLDKNLASERSRLKKIFIRFYFAESQPLLR